MRTFLCFLWLIIFLSLYAESFSQERMNLYKTIKLLGELGPKDCLEEVENATSDRVTSLPKVVAKEAPMYRFLPKYRHGLRFTSLCFVNEPKELDLLVQEIPHALKILYNSTFELFKKKKTHGHWNNDAFQNLMEHLNRQAKSNSVPAMSSELETLVKNFKSLDHFLTQQNFSRCSWEIGRDEILFVMDHFSRKTARRKRLN